VLAVFLALAAAGCFSGSDYAAGLASRGASVVRVTVIVEVTAAVLLVAFVPFASSQSPSLQSLVWGAVAGVGGVVGAMALYLGFKYAAFSVASSVSAVGAAAFSVLAGLLFGERPGALALAGIALALPAIAAVSVSAGPVSTDLAGETGNPAAPVSEHGATYSVGTPTRSALGRHVAGVVAGLVSGAGFGLFFIGLNRAGSGADLWPLAAAELGAVVTVVCVAAVTGQLGLPSAGTRWFSVLSGITAAAGTLAYFLAAHRGLLAVTAVIASLYPSGTIVLARVLLAERLTAVRTIGLCLAAASVAFIAVAGAG
jgi:drug/metabolite transporter (DMT)-like permease